MMRENVGDTSLDSEDGTATRNKKKFRQGPQRKKCCSFHNIIVQLVKNDCMDSEMFERTNKHKSLKTEKCDSIHARDQPPSMLGRGRIWGVLSPAVQDGWSRAYLNKWDSKKSKSTDERRKDRQSKRLLESERENE